MVRSRFLALIAGAAALDTGCDNCGGEFTGLLQRVGRNSLKAKSNEALEQLLTTAKKMLKEGATPEVITFSEDTLKAIKDEVMPAIQRDHNAQQQLVYEHFNATVGFTRTYSTWEERLLEARELQNRDSKDHKACRAAEKQLTTQTENCELELHERWDKVQEVEEDMEDLSERIQTEWCAPDVNRSQDDFRDEAVKKFTKYSRKKASIHEITVHYEEWVSVCESNHTQLMSKKTECEEQQHDLESSACLAADLTREAGNKLVEEWPMVTTIYNDTIASVKKAEAARKKEYTTLMTVECLLKRIKELGGQPCEETEGTGRAEEEIKKCNEASHNTTHLDMDYPTVPETPTSPEPKPVPCTEEFIAQEYANLAMPAGECRPCETMPQMQTTTLPAQTGPGAVSEPEPLPTATGGKSCPMAAGEQCIVVTNRATGEKDMTGYVSCLGNCCQDYDPSIFDGLSCVDVKDMGFKCDQAVPAGTSQMPHGTLLKDICPVTCGACQQ